jgi:tryptophan synthase alpha chain
MSDRYQRLFNKLAEESGEGRGAFVPFTVLGDPTPDRSLEIVRTLALAGADALELGIAFSDPVADGPTIQAADRRALQAGTKTADAWQIIRKIRDEFADLPIGLLVYANLVEAPGRQAFYQAAAAAGVDSVLIADAPTLEAKPFAQIAVENGVLPIMLAPPSASDEHLREIAELSQGYTYVVTRTGVTGADDKASTDHHQLLERLKAFGAPPALLGFGISQPGHIKDAIASGAAGAISGSAVVQRIANHLADPDDKAMHSALREFVSKMAEATRR